MQNGLQNLFYWALLFPTTQKKNTLLLKYYAYRCAHPEECKNLTKNPTMTQSPVLPISGNPDFGSLLRYGIDLDKATALRGPWREDVLLGTGIPQLSADQPRAGLTHPFGKTFCFPSSGFSYF